VVIRRPKTEDPEPAKGRPATTPEGREAQLVSLAMDVAEQQMRAGTASAQVISLFLKLGSSREMLEQERLRQEVMLTAIKAEQIASEQRVEELYRDALNAMRSYQGQETQDERYDYED
jgi:hypothetical protein